MSMAVAMERAAELAANEPGKEACIPVQMTEHIAKKINVASGEDAWASDDVGFDLSCKDAWAWHESMQGVPHVYP